MRSGQVHRFLGVQTPAKERAIRRLTHKSCRHTAPRFAAGVRRAVRHSAPQLKTLSLRNDAPGLKQEAASKGALQPLDKNAPRLD